MSSDEAAGVFGARGTSSGAMRSRPTEAIRNHKPEAHRQANRLKHQEDKALRKASQAFNRTFNALAFRTLKGTLK